MPNTTRRHTERELGDKWAKTRRAIPRPGAWVQKLPASSMAGLPDWLVGDSQGVHFIEAKRVLIASGNHRYSPRQLTEAQRFFLEQVHHYGGSARVVVLGEDGYVELRWPSWREVLTRAQYESRKELYR